MKLFKHAGAIALLLGAAATAWAAPLVPRIISHDINFGGWERWGPGRPAFYAPVGAGPDLLTLAPGSEDREVTAVWPVWPFGIPFPVFNAAGAFGGDIALQLAFFGHDEAPPHLNVSITGTGANTAGPDLVISGAVPALGIPYGPLFALDVRDASLYGYGGQQSYVLEMAGVIAFMDPRLGQLQGHEGVARGNIDFRSLSLPSGYDPLKDYGLLEDEGGYSGETGAGFPTPEPASLLLLAVGGLVVARRR